MRKRLGTIICFILFVVILYAAPENERGYHMEEDPEEHISENSTYEEENDSLQVTENSSENMQAAADPQETEDPQQTEETQDTEEPQDTEAEYENFAIANVSSYVNVRKEPNTDSTIVGRIYSGAVAQILSLAGENEDWFQIISGNVEGYIKAEYFISGEDAAEVMDQYVVRWAYVNVDKLNVRESATTSSKKIGYLKKNEKVKVIKEDGDWLKIQYPGKETAYIASQYVTVAEEYTYATTAAERKAQKAFEAELENRVKEPKPETETKPNNGGESNNVKPPETTYSTNEELRKAIVEYALSYVGSKYVHGGQSLETGTDCSGFTMYVLKEFGYSISRTPQGQYTSAGRAISYSEIQPGDIICYSSNGGKSCTHVAFYIGDGKIVHAANSKKGVVIGSVTSGNICGVKNVID